MAFPCKSDKLRFKSFFNKDDFESSFFVKQFGDILVKSITSPYLDTPISMTMDTFGDFHILNYSNHTIIRFNNRWEYINSYGSAYMSGGRYINSDLSDFIYVNNPSGNNILKFLEGKLIKTSLGFGTGDGYWYTPTGIIVDKSGFLYICDGHTANNRVQKLDSNFNFILKWGSTGTGEGQFNQPYGITIDPLDNIYITEYGAFGRRIQKFHTDGSFIKIFVPPGTFWNVRGIISTKKYIFVTDDGNNRIYVYDFEGNSVAFWGGTGTGTGYNQFNAPAGMYVDNFDNLYICDYGNARILKVKIMNI